MTNQGEFRQPYRQLQTPDYQLPTTKTSNQQLTTGNQQLTIATSRHLTISLRIGANCQILWYSMPTATQSSVDGPLLLTSSPTAPPRMNHFPLGGVSTYILSQLHML